MYFDPKVNKFPYPINTDEHYLKVKKNDGTIFDENYPYINNSKSFKNKRRIFNIPMYLFAIPFGRVRLGLIVKGKKNLRQNKKLIKQGVISISNHVHMFDYLSIIHAIFPIQPRVLVWAPNISGENGGMVKMVGGVPIPENNMKATYEYLNQVGSYLNDGGWLQIYPEGSMWEYYAQIRPFKLGAARLAIKYNKPIIPMAFSYRKPGFIRRVIFKQVATFTLTIGKPLTANNYLSNGEQAKDLTIRCHQSVCYLAGLTPETNLYEPIFDHSKRIDYYTEEYGKGYKKSW